MGGYPTVGVGVPISQSVRGEGRPVCFNIHSWPLRKTTPFSYKPLPNAKCYVGIANRNLKKNNTLQTMRIK